MDDKELISTNPGKTLDKAMQWCKVRGYIARKSNPDKKYWKNSSYFGLLPLTLNKEDAEATDWKCFDSEADDNPLVG